MGTELKLAVILYKMAEIGFYHQSPVSFRVTEVLKVNKHIGDIN